MLQGGGLSKKRVKTQRFCVYSSKINPLSNSEIMFGVNDDYSNTDINAEKYPKSVTNCIENELMI